MSAVANTLERLCEPDRKITYGVVKPGPEVEDGILFIRGGDVFQGRIAESELRTISPQLSEQYKRTILKGGELLVSLVGTPGEVAVVPDSLSGANIARQVGLVPLGTTVHHHFVMYFLRSYQGRAQLFTRTQGAVQQVINLADLKTIEIPDVPSETQTRIASILSAYDDLIENNRRRIQLLEQAARLLYREWFVHLRFPGHEHVTITDGVPEGWKKVPLSELCKDVRESANPKDLPSDTAYIGLEHIPRHSITLNDWGMSSEVNSNKFKFAEGDVLFGKIRPYFHKVGFAIVDGIASSDAIVIRPTDRHLYYYVLFLLSSDEFVSLASKTVREGSKMPRADWKFLLKSEFKYPSEVLLGLFNDAVKPICGQLRNLALYSQQLTQARDLLLPRLMNGEVTP